jgi:hypothetical protein
MAIEPPAFWTILVTTSRVMVRLAIVRAFQQVDRVSVPFTGISHLHAYRLPLSGLIGDFLAVDACLLLIFVSTHLIATGGGHWAHILVAVYLTDR